MYYTVTTLTPTRFSLINSLFIWAKKHFPAAWLTISSPVS
jgi:hypothetical protein